MKVSGEFDSLYGSKVQIARVKDGGNGSWAEKEDRQDDSVRLAWYTEKGAFDPISSAELPLWGLKELVVAATKQDMFPKADLAEMIGILTSSLYRQT